MVRDIFSLVGAVMLCVNRRAQICRSLQAAVELMQLLKSFSARARNAAQEDAKQQQQQQQQQQQLQQQQQRMFPEGFGVGGGTAAHAASPAATLTATGAAAGAATAATATAATAAGAAAGAAATAAAAAAGGGVPVGPAMKKLLSQAVPALHMKAQAIAELLSSGRHYMQSLSPETAAAAAAAADAAAASEGSSLAAAAAVAALGASSMTPSNDASGSNSSSNSSNNNSSSSSSSSSSSNIAAGALYDPRYLVFEFAYSLLLRQSQVLLLDRFLSSVKRGRSMCHQMLMGAGKTTVVSPLLSLLLADDCLLSTVSYQLSPINCLL
ncbi:hypothetical protein EPH_0009710 [Eimeria praecox]|uniref:ubiquitinyl hydrolase 1 n=1 Tax=Eimeria praecox TaxID=51316 RepID=U6GMG9_9EIME|nr:hypothetical protein EPH_0009710 [Eimeria praecox]